MTGDEQRRDLAAAAARTLRAAIEALDLSMLPHPPPVAPPMVDAPQLAPAVAPAAVAVDLETLTAQVAACTLCPLHQSRTRTVFGEGRVTTDALACQVMFVGEGPGYNEDQTGRPFVGAAGELLDKIIIAMKLRREDCYITNIVKCRPPENATPTPDQFGACKPYLVRQIERVRPRFLVALGAPAGQVLTGKPDSVIRMRGRLHRWGDIPLVVTYHPAALLRNAEYKRPAWADLQLVMARLRNG